MRITIQGGMFSIDGDEIAYSNIKDMYLIERNPSIFVSRSGKEDCIIMKRNRHGEYHGSMENDGHRYNTIARIAAETGEILRDYGSVPKEITPALLVQWGFVDQNEREIEKRDRKN